MPEVPPLKDPRTPLREARSAPSGVGSITVLGLDPGTRNFGWGIVRREGTRLVHVAHGVFAVANDGDLGERLVSIEIGLVGVIEKHRPDQASIESLFFA